MELPNINQKKIENLLEEGKRLDGRAPFDYRDISIETGISKNAEGSSRVRIGKTEVIVGVKMGVQEPYPDHEDEGTMMVGMEFNPICGERYESGPPKINAIEVARVVDRGVRESKVINFKKLCIKEGEKVWCVMIDIYCINDDGNVFDASALGTMAALRVAKMPVYDEKTEKVKFGEFTDNPLPLTKEIPFSMTFYKIKNKFLIDPNRNEEDASEARITIALSCSKKDKIINAMQKGGIVPILTEDLNKIVLQSEKIYEAVYPDLNKKIEGLKK